MNPFATATELLADLRAGTITSSDLTDRYIRRIEHYDTKLNAVVVRDFERARQAARAADQSGAGALRGLPITLKESINVRAAGRARRLARAPRALSHATRSHHGRAR
jgi:amidase